MAEPIVMEDSVRAAWQPDRARTLASPGNLFPSRIGWSASADNTALWEALDGQAASGYRAFPAEIVAVPKSSHATRPAADLSTEDQLLYAAIVDALRARVPDGLVAFTDDNDNSYEQFEAFPLEQPGTTYVVEGDAAAFFQFVDYELLAYELVGLTGWADAVEALTRLLQVWMAERRGLPQGPAPSRALADIYISPAARALSRGGWTFSRFSDDFRIATSSWGEARSAQLALEHALARQRLVPAANKTRTWKATRYRERIERANAPRLVGEASRTAFEGIAGEYVATSAGRFTVSPGEVVLAESVIREQAESFSSDPVVTRLIRWSLGVLGNGPSTVGLPLFSTLMDRHPHATQAAAGYLRLLMGTPFEQQAVRAATTWMGAPSFHFPWQTGWILHAIALATERDERAARLGRTYLSGGSIPWFVRGQGALVSAVHGDLPSLNEFVSVYELSPRATRPDFVAAILIGQPTWGDRFLEGVVDSPLLSAVARLDPEDREDWL